MTVTLDNPSTYKAAVYDLLYDARSGTVSIDGTTHTTPAGWVPSDLVREVGGRDGLRRLRELRSAGYRIDKRRPAGKNRTTRFEYKLARVNPVV